MPGHPALDIWTMVYSATDADYRFLDAIKVDENCIKWMKMDTKTQTKKDQMQRMSIRYALKKNYGIIWEFFPSGGPPPPHPPLLGTPYSKKKNYRLFCILGP